MKLCKMKVMLPLILLCCFMGISFPAMAKDFLYIPCVNALQVIDCESDTVVKTIPYNDYILNAAYSSDGKRYYLNAIHSIYVIDTVANKLIDTHKISSELSKVDIFGMAVSGDDKKLYLSCSIVKKKQNIPKLNVYPPQLVVYDLAKRKMVKNYQIPSAFTAIVTLRNDPDQLFLVGLDIHKIDLKTGKFQKMMGLLNPEKSEKGKNALVIWQNNRHDDHGIFANPYYTATGMGYFIIDKNTGKISTLKGKDILFEYSNVVSPDQKYIYGVMDELIKIDMKTGETVKMISVEKGTCYVVNQTSDGKKLYVGPAGADVSVYDAETLALLGVIPLAGDGVIAHIIPQ